MPSIKKPFIFLLFFLLCNCTYGQWVLINEGGGQPDGAAALDIQSTDKGILIPRMLASERLSISSPVQGLLVYQTNGEQGFYYHNGLDWDTLAGSSIINNISNNITEASNSRIAVVRDIKGPNIDGGSIASGSWVTRDLNDLRGDSSFISINGSTNFSLDSGIYEINAIAAARQVAQHQIRLFNVTDGIEEAVGTAINSASATPSSNLYTIIKITQTTTFEIQHRCENDNFNSDALGRGISWGDNVYTQIRIQKL